MQTPPDALASTTKGEDNKTSPKKRSSDDSDSENEETPAKKAKLDESVKTPQGNC